MSSVHGISPSSFIITMASSAHCGLALILCLCLLSVSLPTVFANGGGSCATDWDCALGGTCDLSSSVCECDIWWTGPHCQQLNLQRASRSNGLNLAVNTSTWTALTSPQPSHTWCTSVHYDPDSDDYFAVVSFMMLHCTLDYWTTNSEVVLVRGSSPFGPFDPAGLRVLLPPFAHNPKVVRYIDGMWLLFFIGAVDGSIKPTNCTTGSASQQPQQTGSARADPGNDGARVAMAKSSSGPWTLWNGGAALFAPNDSVWYHNCVTNPAPVVLPNGTVLLYFTANPDSVHGPHTGNAIAVARAPHWSGPYTVLDTDGGVTSPDAEDPFVLRDHRGHFHMLVNTNTGHWMSGNLTGLYTGHAWSYDGITWSDQYLGSVATTVHFDDGSSTVFSYRERPDIYTDNDRKPIAFATGMTGVDGYSDSFSFVQPICTSETQLCYGGIDKPSRRIDARHRTATAARVE